MVLSKQEPHPAWHKVWSEWIHGDYAVELIDEHDHSEAYEMDCIWLFRLASGRYATVEEQGCSCYDHDDAALDLFADLESAQQDMRNWRSERKLQDHLYRR